jgi:hypothetical protein
MISAQTIRKLSFFIAVASFAFTIILAFVQYLLLDLTTLGAPANYYLYSVLVEIVPYLFVGVVALLVSVMWHDEEPKTHEEAPSTPEVTQNSTA